MDWRDYRIPVKDRKAVVTRYYMIHLVRRMRSRDSLQSTVSQLVKHQKELVDFLKSFGADNIKVDIEDLDREADDKEAEMQDHPEMQDFWYFPDDVILDTICM